MSAASNGGLDVYSGGIDMHSTSISNLADPSSAQDAATRGWVNTNDDYEADTNTDASTTCTGSNYLAGDGSCNADTNTNTQLDDENPNSNIDMQTYSFTYNGGTAFDDSYIQVSNGAGSNHDIKVQAAETSTSELYLSSNDYTSWSDPDSEIVMSGDSDTSITIDGDIDTANDCVVNDGTLTCNSKNWRHKLNSTYEAFYTSQESPQVRAVYEGMADVDGKTRVELPSHFSKTVSDTEPKLRATATVQGELAYAAVIEKTDDYIVLDSSEPATVNYRITGIREGYEDKQVVRKKEE